VALTGKQALFVEEYLKCLNKTEAARRAGYDGNDVTLGAIGYENFKKPQIEEAIKQRLAEVAMSSDEVLKRLAEHARGNMGDFWKIPANGSPVLDLTSDRAKTQLHLIKKMKVKTTTKLLVGDGESLPENEDSILINQLVTTEIDFELYDAQAALEKLGKHHKLFVERTELTGLNGGPIEHKEVTQLSDDELANIASGGGRGITKTPEGPQQST